MFTLLGRPTRKATLFTRERRQHFNANEKALTPPGPNGWNHASSFATVTLWLVVFSTGLAAQSTVIGQVQTADGLPIFGATVENETMRAYSDRAGFFVLDDVSYGSTELLVRRIGFHPVRVSVRVPPRDSVFIDAVTLTADGVELGEIQVVAEAPLSRKGMRDFLTAYRVSDGYYLTASAVDSIAPFDVAHLADRIPGFQRRTDPRWGQRLECSRGRTAIVVVDGIRTANPNPDMFLRPDLVGAMWFEPGRCRLVVWSRRS